MNVLRKPIAFLPFDVKGNSFTGSVSPFNENKITGGDYIPETKKEAGEIYFLFEWKIKIGEASIFAQLKVAYGLRNDLIKPTEQEFLNVAEMAAKEAKEAFEFELEKRKDLFISNDHSEITFSLQDKEFINGILNRRKVG